MVTSGIDEISWARTEARSGAGALSIGGRRLDGAYDPERDADRLADRLHAEAEGAGHGLALIGAGLDHLPRALRRRGVDPIVWEPFPRIRAALGLDPDAVLLDRASFDGRVAASPQPVRIVPLPGLTEICGFELRAALRAARQRAGARPLAPEAAIVSQRAVDGLRRLPERRIWTELAPVFDAGSVVVACPGPSLEAFLPVLRARRGGIVVAAPQSLARLAAADVPVDGVVASDPRDFRECFESMPPGDPFLLADAAVQPELLDRAPDRTFCFHLRSPQATQLAWDRAGLETIDEPFVSVSEISLELAMRLGAQEVFLLGADLASADPRYAIRFETPDVHGRPVTTNSSYHHSRRDLDDRVPRWRAAGRVVWRPRVGLPVAGTEPLDPGALAERLAAADRFELASARNAPSANALRAAACQAIDGLRAVGPPPSSAAAAVVPPLAPLDESARADALSGLARALGSPSAG